MDDWDEAEAARDRALDSKELEALRNRALDKDTLAAREAVTSKDFPCILFPNGLPKTRPGPGETRWPKTPSGYPAGDWTTAGESGKDSEGTIP